MYDFFEMISLIYSTIVFIAIMIFPFTIEKDKIFKDSKLEGEELKGNDCKWKKIFQNIILLLAVGICIVGIIWLVKHKEYIWILLPFTVLTFFERLNDIYMSMGVVRKTLHSSGEGLLSVKEQVSIMSIALFVLILYSYGLLGKCLQIADRIQNVVLSDVCLLLILIVIVTIYFFLGGAMLLIPVKTLIRLTRFLGKRITLQWMTTVTEKYIKWHQQIGKSEYVSIRFWAWGLEKKWRLILVVPALIFTIVFDAFLKIIIGTLKIFLLIVEHIFNGFIQVIKLVIQFSQWVIGISDRKVMILSFRSALVFSLTSIVIVNRYVPIIKKYEAGTAVLEFCSSAIVIPLVLSWIMDYRNKSNLNNSNDDNCQKGQETVNE